MCLQLVMCLFWNISDAPLDLKIKSNMISDLFSLVGMSLFMIIYTDTRDYLIIALYTLTYLLTCLITTFIFIYFFLIF